jgi:hypothetical protein
MFRTAAAVIGFAFLATAANAAEIKVTTLDKSPAEVRAAITDAAVKACNAAYSGDNLFIYERDACVRNVVADTVAKVELANATAMNAQRPALVAGSR